MIMMIKRAITLDELTDGHIDNASVEKKYIFDALLMRVFILS